jgi:CRP-like cAMP-binding protein
VEAGSAIFQQGADASGAQSSFYIVREGRVVLRTRIREVIERDIAEVSPGQLFGGLPMISAKCHCESAIARTRCTLLEIDERAFLHLMRSRSWVAQKLAFAAARAYAQRTHATLESLDARS